MDIIGRNKIGFILTLFFMAGSLLQQDYLLAKEKDVNLQWKKVPRAYGYIVDVKDENENIVISQKTTASSVKFKLPRGVYKARISVLNKFQKVSVQSKWFEIKIIAAMTPNISSVSKTEFLAGKGRERFSIYGSDFQKNCRVSFRQGDRLIGAFKVVFNSEKSLSVTISKPSFPPGYYDLIVTNPGGRSTEAAKKIFMGAKPVFRKIDPAVVARVEDETVLQITGNNFMEGCTVVFEQKGKKYKPERVRLESEKKILATIEPSSFDEGEYSIIISNTSNFFVKSGKVLKFVTPIYPSISSVAPSVILKGDKSTEFIIEGENFIEGCTISLLKEDSTKKIDKLVSVSGNKISFSINSSEFDVGDYNIKITNPDGASFTYDDAVEIYTRRKLLGIYIGVSPIYNYILGSWADTVKSSFTGFNFYAGYGFSFLETVPVIRDMGVELNFDYVSYSNNQADEFKVESELVTLAPALGIYYCNNFGLPFDFIVRAGGGMAISELTTTDTAINESETFSSSDPCYYGGVSARYRFLYYFFTETGIEYQSLMYVSSPLNALHAFLRVGVIF